MASNNLTKDQQIAQLTAQLQRANANTAAAASQHYQAKASLSKLKRTHTACLNQLARAHAHIQNVHLAGEEPEKYSYDKSKIREWLMSLENAVPEETFECVLTKTRELDIAGYGTKDQQAAVSDIRPSSLGFDQMGMMGQFH
ncbi:hypothetical protein LTR85_011078 [Meristemomyces frigidus]|nr:hypothetical protein LTR85_011078 [Meristemomyces frigidus]